METGHFSLVGNLPNINVVELPRSAFDDRLSHACAGFGDVTNLGAIYGICGLTSIAEDLL